MGIEARLERDCDRIDGVFHGHGIGGRVDGGRVTPYVIRYRFVLDQAADADRARSLAGELAAALGVPACRVYRQGMAVVVEVPRGDETPVRLLPLLRTVTDVPPVTAALGMDDEGVPLLIHLPSPDVRHVLVTGVEGCGKTTLLRTMALSLALRHPRPGRLALVLIDAGGAGAFDGFDGLPHLVQPVVRDPIEAVEVLSGLARPVKRRRMGWSFAGPVLVVFVDELAALGGQAVSLLSQLVGEGHEAAVHVVAATERPSLLSDITVFPVRIVGKVATAYDAWAATDRSGTRAERLGEPGDFIAVAEGQAIRFKAAYVGPGEVREVVRTLQREALPAEARPTAVVSLPAPA